jgi:uncharacterized protein YjeT (DUF2065 family)
VSGFFLEKTSVNELLSALAMVMVIEGILPFLSPKSLRSYMTQMIDMDDRSLRIAGLVLMVMGMVMLYFIKN